MSGEAETAITGGLKVLALRERLHGTGALELAPCFLHLARCSQNLGKPSQAEEFLSLARWAIVSRPPAPTALRAELHQTFGLLYAASGRLDAALEHLATAVYFLTQQHGSPDRVGVSFALFDLGNVHAARGAMDAAMALYECVKTAWLSHLEVALGVASPSPSGASRPSTAVAAAAGGGASPATAAALGGENLADAARMLSGLLGLQRERLGPSHPLTARAALTVGLFHKWVGNAPAAQQQLGEALAAYVAGGAHAQAAHVRNVFIAFGWPPEIPASVAASAAAAPAPALSTGAAAASAPAAGTPVAAAAAAAKAAAAEAKEV